MRNVFVMAIILIISIVVQYGVEGCAVAIGPIRFSGLAFAAITGIFLNAVLPQKQLR